MQTANVFFNTQWSGERNKIKVDNVGSRSGLGLISFFVVCLHNAYIFKYANNAKIFKYFVLLFQYFLYIVSTHTEPKYLDNIVEIFRGNIVRLLKYFETYHEYC